jgi:hypothetical protein
MKKNQQRTRMYKIQNFFLAALTIFMAAPLSIEAQITVTPTFPRVDDNITITYNSAQGNAALSSTTPVYIHTGYTSAASPNAWPTAVQSWGTNNATTLMTDIGGGSHQKMLNVRSYYGIPSGIVPPKLGMVFRSANNSLVGKTSAEGDIFQDIWDGTSFQTKIVTPSVSSMNVAIGATINVQCATSVTGNLRLLVDGVTVTPPVNGGTSISGFESNRQDIYLLRIARRDGSKSTCGNCPGRQRQRRWHGHFRPSRTEQAFRVHSCELEQLGVGQHIVDEKEYGWQLVLVDCS